MLQRYDVLSNNQNYLFFFYYIMFIFRENDCNYIYFVYLCIRKNINPNFKSLFMHILYCGAPVFGTPYGSLPELVHDDVGFLTSNKEEMISYLSGAHIFSPIVCHEYASDMFNSKVMCERYLQKYEKVMNGERLNTVKPHAMETESKIRDSYLF